MLKKIILYRGIRGKKSSTLSRKISKWCSSSGIKFAVADKPERVNNFLPADMIISMGGDGTLLSLASQGKIHTLKTPILGLNLGRLGFLSETDPNEILPLLRTFHKNTKGKIHIEERGMLDVLLGDKTIHTLNDCVIKRAETGRPATITVTVGNEYLADYTGDGLIISTPTGSTAYSLSSGGPILHPHTGSSAILITPIAPHTLSQRPIIVSGNHTILIKRATSRPAMRSRRSATDDDCDKILVFADGNMISQNLTETLKIRSSELKFNLVKNPSKRYFGILREKLGWG